MSHKQLAYRIIKDNKELTDVCALITGKYLAVDTEFIRVCSYYPKLGLIQLYWGDEFVILIDPLKISDWQSLRAILLDKQITKLFHACSEDLSVIFHHINVIPSPVIDTQLMAEFMGVGLGCGFAKLVLHFLQVQLDKNETRTDWLARPLSEKQCQYASADVYYLLPLVKRMIKQFNEPLAKKWWLMEQQHIVEKVICQQQKDPKYAYLDISNLHKLKNNQLLAIQKLAAWRLEYAIQNDIALNFVVNEQSLWKVARYLPSSLYELQNLSLSSNEIRIHGKTMLALCRDLSETDKNQEKILQVNVLPYYKFLNYQIRKLVAEIAQKHHLPESLLASRKQINQFIKWFHKLTDVTPELLNGWRKTLLEERIIALVEPLKNKDNTMENLQQIVIQQPVVNFEKD